MHAAFARRLLRAPYVRSVLSGVLVLSALYVPYLWPLIFVALVPVILSVVEAPSMRAAYARGLPCGLMVGAGATWWLLTAQPDALPSFFLTLAFSLGTWSAWLLTTGVIGGVFALWMPVVHFFTPRTLPRVLVLAVAFVLLEYLRMHAFNLLSAGESVHNLPWFSFGFLGYALADSPIWLQLAAFGGVYTLSFVVAFVNVYSARTPHKARSRALVALALVLVVALVPLPELQNLERPSESQIVLGVMSLAPQGSERSVRSTAFKDVLDTTIDDLAAQGASVIALPEGASVSAREGVTFIESATDFAPPELPRFVSMIRTAAGADALRTKRVLVPQGEYPTWIYRMVVNTLGLSKDAQAMTGVLSYRTGAPKDVKRVPGFSGSVLLCSEAFAPLLGARVSREMQSTFIVVLLSHARFGWAPTLEIDTRRALQLRAIEAGLPLVASGAYTPGYVIDQHGRVQLKVEGNAVTFVPTRR